MISLIKIFSLLFALFAVSRAVLRAKDKKISFGEMLFWLAVWSGLLFVVYFPSLTNYLAILFGIGRGIDVIIYLSIAALFYLIFRLYVKLEENQKSITLLVREIAMQKRKK